MAARLPTNPALPPRHGPYATVRWAAERDPPHWVRTLTAEGQELVRAYLAHYEPKPGLVLYTTFPALAQVAFRRLVRDDVHQAARIGVANAAALYQPERAKFITAAVWGIRAAIQKELVRRAHQPTVYSLDESLVHEGDETPRSHLLAGMADNPPEIDWLPIALRCLDRRNRVIVRLILDGQTYVEIGRRYGISKERVRQLWIEARKTILRQHPWLYGLAPGGSPFRRGV